MQGKELYYSQPILVSLGAHNRCATLVVVSLGAEILVARRLSYH